MHLIDPSRLSLRWIVAVGIAGLLFIACIGSASAAQEDNATCLGCHTTPGLNVVLPDGEPLSLTMDAAVFNASVHGALKCTACHTNIEGYPHPKITAHDRRTYQMDRYQQCQTCHADQYEAALDSNHARALAAGNRNAAICTDCHGSHDISIPNQPRQKISTTCGNCHSTINEAYSKSVHGAALLEASNPDVPVCTDCHGAHSQQDPTTQAFRLKSPNLCAKCHGDASMMRRYNISTEVFDTYVADFHGTTVTLFEKQHPDQVTNKAVCTDCHGIHDIQSVSAASSTVVKENLLATCRRCHPDATANFPDSWVGHFAPTRDRFPLVYYVDLFYRFLIPAVIGSMALFVLVDAGSRIVRRFRKGRA